MQVFISWSAEPSATFAKALADWLPTVIQSVKPFLSSNDIRSGQRWLGEIGKQLQETQFGILCLTPNNKEAPWILFEAGAISKVVEESRVVPLLIGMEKSQLIAPLTQFQARHCSKEDMQSLVKDINASLPAPLDDKRLSETFEAFWPKLSAVITEAEATLSTSHAPAKKRPPEEMVEEILNIVRSLGISIDSVKSQILMTQMSLHQELLSSRNPSAFFSLGGGPALNTVLSDQGSGVPLVLRSGVGLSKPTQSVPLSESASMGKEEKPDKK